MHNVTCTLTAAILYFKIITCSVVSLSRLSVCIAVVRGDRKVDGKDKLESKLVAHL